MTLVKRNGVELRAEEYSDPNAGYLHVKQEIRDGSITPTTFLEIDFRDADKAIVSSLRTKLTQSVDALGKITEDLKQVTETCGKILPGMTGTVYKSMVTIPKNKAQLELNEQRVKLLSEQTQFFFGGADKVAAPIFFENAYEHNGIRVVEYGINAHNAYTMSVLPKYNQDLMSFNQKMMKYHKEQFAEYTKEMTLKKSQSGFSDKNIKAFDVPEVAYLLHPAEIYVLEKAIRILSDSTDNNVVVINIFEREQSGTRKGEIKLNGDITHAVVLFKNSDKELIIIDPNNSESSNHLAASYNTDIFGDMELISSEQKVEIYKGGNVLVTERAGKCANILLKWYNANSSTFQEAISCSLKELIGIDLTSNTKKDEIQKAITDVYKPTDSDVEDVFELFLTRLRVSLDSNLPTYGSPFEIDGNLLEIYTSQIKSRDCVDVAVKIASGLLYEKEDEIKVEKKSIGKVIDLKSLKSMPTIQQVTNNLELNEDLYKGMGIAKIRQASDFVVRKKIGTIVSLMKQELDYLQDVKPDNVFKQVQQDYYTALSIGDENTQYTTCIKSLVGLIHTNAEVLLE